MIVFCVDHKHSCRETPGAMPKNYRSAVSLRNRRYNFPWATWWQCSQTKCDLSAPMESGLVFWGLQNSNGPWIRWYIFKATLATWRQECYLWRVGRGHVCVGNLGSQRVECVWTTFFVGVIRNASKLAHNDQEWLPDLGCVQQHFPGEW
jgi:hypothetical protein